MASLLSKPRPERAALARLTAAVDRWLALHALPKGADEREVRAAYRELQMALRAAKGLR